jgi:hypothetical protein
LDFRIYGYDNKQQQQTPKQQIILIMTSVSTQINASNVDVSKVKAQVAKVICLSKTDLRRHCKEQGIESDGSLKAMRADAANRFIDMLPAGKGESAPKLCRSIRQDKWQMGTWILQQQIHEAEKEGRVPPSELCVSGLYDPPGFLRWKFVVKKLNGVWLNETYFHLRLINDWVIQSSCISGKTSNLYEVKIQ